MAFAAIAAFGCATEQPTEPGFQQLSQTLTEPEVQPAAPVERPSTVGGVAGQKRELTRSIPALTVAWAPSLSRSEAILSEGQTLDAVIRNTVKRPMNFKLVVICIDSGGGFHHNVVAELELAAESELQWSLPLASLPNRSAGGPTTVMLSAAWNRDNGRSSLRFDAPRLQVTFDESFKQAHVRSDRAQLLFNAQQVASGNSVRPVMARVGTGPATMLGSPDDPTSRPSGYTLLIPDGALGLSGPPPPQAAE